MRNVIHKALARLALTALLIAVVAAPDSAVALTPDDALQAFDMYLHKTDECVQHADGNCDGAVTPGDARSLYRRYLLDLPAGPCADDTENVQAPPSLVMRHHIEAGIPGHPTTYEVTIEVEAPGNVTAFGIRIDYPTEQLRLVHAEPGVDVEHWIAADAVERTPGEIVAGGFDVGMTAGSRPLQLVRIVFEAFAPVDWRRIAVRETIDDLAGASARSHVDDTIAAPSAPASFRLHEVEPGQALPAIRYDIPIAPGGNIRTRLAVYDASGGVARVLVDGMQAPGFHATCWDGTLRDGSAARPGVYYARLQVRMGAMDFVDSMRLVIQ